MKLLILLVALTIVLVECKHTFMGFNANRPLVFHKSAEYSAKIFRKRVENITFTIPNIPAMFGRHIQGILAFDMTHSEASANVTNGGLGFNFVNIRMKSERGKKLHYDIYIYA